MLMLLAFRRDVIAHHVRNGASEHLPFASGFVAPGLQPIASRFVVSDCTWLGPGCSSSGRMVSILLLMDIWFP